MAQAIGLHLHFRSVALATTLLAIPLAGQIYRYYHPGTIWTVTTIRIHSGMDPAYLQYLDGAFKKDSHAAVKAKYKKSYKGSALRR